MASSSDLLLWGIVLPLAALGALTLVNSYLKARSHIGSARCPNRFTLTYRGVAYGRSPHLYPLSDLTARDPKANTIAPVWAADRPTIPQSIVRLTYRGISYIRVR